MLDAPTAMYRGLFTLIGEALHENVGVDLVSSRHDVALRALSRRLRAVGLESLKSYAQMIIDDPVEPRRLARALLPADTEPLLPAEALSVLGVRLAASQTASAPQIWVTECGEGEEVYALAMQVHGLLAAGNAKPQFIVHGSDTDAGALEIARSGLLAPTFIGQVPVAQRPQFIQQLAHGVLMQPAVQQHCQFHQQFLMAAPPVAGVDVLSGRNILRFLSESERRVLLQHWHAALKPGGLLLLGPGERVDGGESLFAEKPLAPGVFLRQAGSASGHGPGVTTPATPSDQDVGVYRRAFASSQRPSALLDGEGRVLDVNAAFASLLGGTAKTLVTQQLQDLCIPEHRSQLTKVLRETAQANVTPRTLRLSVTLKAATGELPLQLLLHLHAGPCIRVHVEVETHPERSKRKAVQLPGLEAVLNVMSEGCILLDHAGHIRMLNAAALRLTGWSENEAMGRPVAQVFRLLSPLGERLSDPVAECLHSGLATVIQGQQAQLLTRDGQRMAVDVRVTPVENIDGRMGAALLFSDVSRQLLVAEELAWRSSHDTVTGLLNRDEFELRVRSVFSRIRSAGDSAVVCIIDIDQFRLINDVLGHASGDELLHELAAELRVRLGENDVLARLSGDEFGVLLPGRELRQVEPLVQSLLQAARSYRFQWLDRKHSVTLSIGVAQIGPDTESVGAVISLADAACHAAKEAGRDRACFMGRDDEAALHHSEMGVVGQVGRAIEDGRLFLFCEDVVSIAEPGTVVYRELLVRMRGDDGAVIKPAHFVPAAERYFLMSALDRWVVTEALAKLAKLPTGAHRDILYAINVSGQSISDPEFFDFMVGEIERTGVDPTRLCFELTETAAVSRLTDAASFVRRLSERGCKFALDDFGVGMSSFGYLKNFPVHFLKIDGSFVRSMRDSQIDRGMVETINRIGHQLGLKTIAEHVESLDLLEPLRELGVDWAQGHGITPGRSLDDLLK